MPSPNVVGADTIDQFRIKVNNHFNDSGEHAGGGSTDTTEIRATDAPYSIDRTGATPVNTGLRAALDAAAASATKKTVVVPSGIYLVRMYDSASNASAIVVPAGVTLRGESPEATIFILDNNSYTAHGNGASPKMIFYATDTVLKEFAIDGRAAAITQNTVTDITVQGLKPSAQGVTDVHLQNIWVYDFKTIGAREGFAINADENSERYLWESLRTWNIIGGTGIHAAAADLSNRAKHIEIVDSWAWACGWQGIGTHASQDISIRDCKTWDNTGAGINMEWTLRAEVSDCETYNNGKMGVRTIGHAKGIRLHNVTSRGNNPTDQAATQGSGSNSNANTSAEIAFMQGVFLDNTTYGTIEDAEIVDCKVTPFTGRPHMYVQNYSSATVNPTTHPTAIELDGHDVHKWFITGGDWGYTDPSQSVPVLTTGTFFRRTPTVGSVYLKQPNQYTNNSTTLTTPSGEGTTNPGAVVVNSTAASQFAYTAQNLMPGRTYKIRFRVKQKQAENWNIRLKRPSATEERRVKLGMQTLDVDKWVEGEMVHTVADTTPLRIEFNHAGSSTNTQLVVDYCWAEEIQNRESGAFVMDAQGRNISSTAAPTAGPPDGGTWRVGDKVWAEAPAASGFIGWVCTTAGNPGTWKTWGAISA